METVAIYEVRHLVRVAALGGVALTGSARRSDRPKHRGEHTESASVKRFLVASARRPMSARPEDDKTDSFARSSG
jgi:hypothetical protein